MVTVEATALFVTILPNEVVSATPGDRISLPKARADALVAAGYARHVEPVAAPETKDSGKATPVKGRRSRPKPQAD